LVTKEEARNVTQLSGKLSQYANEDKWLLSIPP